MLSKKTITILVSVIAFHIQMRKTRKSILNHMLAFLRHMGDTKMVTLTSEFFRDLNWFCTFLKQFNGIVYYDVRSIQAGLHLDACLTRLGGIFDKQCYVIPIPKYFNQYSIAHPEMVIIVVVLTIWDTQWSNKNCI